MARVKTSFSNSTDCIKAFLTGTNPRGKYGRRLYFEGSTLYSYGSHFPLAYLGNWRDGKRAIFIRDACPTMTTRRHRGALWWIAKQRRMIIIPVDGLDTRSHDWLAAARRTFRDTERLLSERTKSAGKFSSPYCLDSLWRELKAHRENGVVLGRLSRIDYWQDHLKRDRQLVNANYSGRRDRRLTSREQGKILEIYL